MFETDGLLELGETLAAADASVLSDGELFEGAVTLARLESLLAAARGHVLGELDARGACDRQFGLGTAAWLAREAATSGAAARGEVRVARKLREHLGEVDAALTTGRISYEHARVLAGVCHPRVVEAIVGLQGELIDAADGVVFEQWKHEVRRLVELVDQDGPHDPNAELARNRVRLGDGLDGVGHLDGAFTAELWPALKHAIQQRADELFRRFTRDHTESPELAVPPRTTLLALALAELVREGLGVDLDSTAPPNTELSMVLRRRDDDGETLTDGDNVSLPAVLLPAVLCFADLFVIIEDRLGVPLDMGRKIRLANRAQRRAIAARDGGCVFPGCDRPVSWLDVHHLDPYHHGGHTDVARMAGLCRHHHGVVHRTGWTMTTTTDGWFTFHTPNGHTIASQRHHKRRPDQPPPNAATRHAA